ncbi:hypothetical protein [Nocardia grenadensis]|uniref:hypothetical protein n=1 Tax=Nocardia grenadensis TaxID=931537 RepID=UPI003D8DE4D8
MTTSLAYTGHASHTAQRTDSPMWRSSGCHRPTPTGTNGWWRRDDIRPLVRGYVQACRSALAGTAGSRGPTPEIK